MFDLPWKRPAASLLALAVALCRVAHADGGGFELVAAGVQGGLVDGDLSCWLVRRPGDRHYLALDAGSLIPGIARALGNGAFRGLAVPAGSTTGRAGFVLREGIGAYFISHPHLDHVAGLVAVSPDDKPGKPVYGLASTLEALSASYFNWSTWPNLTDGGPPPRLGIYHYRPVRPGKPFEVADTGLKAEILPLQHDRIVSSMLLLRDGEDYLAYFGDTGPDAVQHSDKLDAVWRRLAPLVRAHALKAMVIETSYPDGTPDDRLYGHLTPAWLARELGRLEAYAGGGGALRGLDVFITHIKPSFDPAADPRKLIGEQLRQANRFGLRLHVASQGDWFRLPP